MIDNESLRREFLGQIEKEVSVNFEFFLDDYAVSYGIRYLEKNGKTFFCVADILKCAKDVSDISRCMACPEEKRVAIHYFKDGKFEESSFYESEFLICFLKESGAPRAKGLINWMRSHQLEPEQDAKSGANRAPQTYSEALLELQKQSEEKEALQAQLVEERARAKQLSRETGLRILIEILTEAEKKLQQKACDEEQK